MENIKGLKRTAYCTDLLKYPLGTEVTVMGWCQKQRDLGGLIFISLRDRSGEIQLCFDEETSEALKQKASLVRSEFVLAAKGILRKRSSVNPKQLTGEIEIHVQELRILSASLTPPFYIDEDLQANESLRLKHRYLDLRRPNMQRNLMLRHRLTHCVHDYFHHQGFLEIETPMLCKSTPEGARDYLVPSRVFEGKFFALPQSPQLYKQLLMISGFDRYIQIARCFRDEDLRADRQPEFTQIDLEMSFVDCEDVFEVVEGFMKKSFAELLGQELSLPLPRMTYEEAMRRFGSDKPDLRFGMELQDASEWASGLDFVVFKEALANKGSVGYVCVKQAEQITRKQVDAFAEYVKTYKAKGLAWLAFDETPRGSFLKFLTEEKIEEIKKASGAEKGDMLLFVADKKEIVLEALGQLRVELARKLGLLEGKEHKLLWVTEFPLFEYDEEENRYVAKHHPFTSPMDEDLAYLETEPARVRAKAYDLVMNGTELGGGSIRIHQADIQEKMFSLLGFTKEQAYENFSFLLDALQYGVPPHGGCALGLDRLVMLFAKCQSLREVIAFPKVQTSADLMSEAPNVVSEKQLEELSLSIRIKEKAKDTENEI